MRQIVNMDTSQKPKVLLINGCTKPNPDVIQGILGTRSGRPENLITESELLKEHLLKIDNKYYTADLNLISTSLENHDKILNQKNVNYQAIIVSFEMGSVQSVFSRIKTFGDLLKDDDIEIKILFATETERCGEFEEDRKMVLQWCVENSFELVECYQTDDNEDFPEKFGFERIKEALHTHIWPNMVEKSRSADGVINRILDQQHVPNVAHPEPTQNPVGATDGFDPTISGTELEEQSFEEMFSKLQDMKMHANSLSGEERKEYAEKMAIAFWRAMGQDEDEISGL